MSPKLKSRMYAAAVLFAAITGGALAYARTNLTLQPSGRPQTSIVLSGYAERDRKQVPLEQAGAVKPGEVLRWTITSANDGTAPAHAYSAIGQIPVGMSFIAGSAAVDDPATITYSIDGGRNYTPQPLIEEKQADGSIKHVPAPVTMYTQIRFQWQNAFNAGGKLSASYKAQVK